MRDIQELKAVKAPAQIVKDIMEVVLIILDG
jgi:hypothetical protein